jgi:hypothetical protein
LENTELDHAIVATAVADGNFQALWDIEHLPRRDPLTTDAQTTVWQPGKRFTVSMPFRSDCQNLAVTRPLALRRLLSMERALTRDSLMAACNRQFMLEYETLGHMECVPISELSLPAYHIPHHAVLREVSSSTKLRVVFDAAAKCGNGASVNKLLAIGKIPQDTLMSILLRFHTHIYAFSADISEMYRCINIDRKQWNYQRILWRNSPEDPI